MSLEIPKNARLAARILLIDADDRLLLLHAEEPLSRRRFWLLPGGGLDDGESFEAAARRELYEETGLDVQPHPWVWTRRHAHSWDGRPHDQYERIFVARVPRCEIAAPKPDDYLLGHRWWALAEIETSREDFAPRALARLLPPILRGEYPDTPSDCGI
jgi:8-oxo-dGTP pyrophosphatase MutT (NUDIX family)